MLIKKIELGTVNILDEIIRTKKLWLQARKSDMPLGKLQRLVASAPPVISLKGSLLDPRKSGIIAEFKRKSPSRGFINRSADAGKTVNAYAALGASAISVLTDEPYFGGSLLDLAAARNACQIPILRKEFIIDPYQVFESRAGGADAILLIAACLDRGEIANLASLAHSLGLEILLEVHDDSELDKISGNVDMVGVNNRDLNTFVVDLQHSFDLVDQIPPGKLKVTESGISNPETVIALKKAGFDGFLIGESFMRHENPGVAFREFALQLNHT
jgi:indole-3-glycerol phosphate synthase